MLWSFSLLVYITYILHDSSLLFMQKLLRMHHFRSKICSLPSPKLHSCLENHFRNPNSNQYYQLMTFGRGGCGRRCTTKEMIISHFPLRIFNINLNCSTICIWGIYFAVYAIFQSLWFMSCFPWYMLAANVTLIGH